MGHCGGDIGGRHRGLIGPLTVGGDAEVEHRFAEGGDFIEDLDVREKVGFAEVVLAKLLDHISWSATDDKFGDLV